MIKCNDGGTEFRGSTLDFIQDFTNIVLCMRKILSDKYSKDFADKIIALTGEMAYAIYDDDKAHEQEILEHVTRVLDEA